MLQLSQQWEHLLLLLYTDANRSVQLQHDPQDLHSVDLPPPCYIQNTPNLSLWTIVILILTQLTRDP